MGINLNETDLHELHEMLSHERLNPSEWSIDNTAETADDGHRLFCMSSAGNNGKRRIIHVELLTYETERHFMPMKVVQADDGRNYLDYSDSFTDAIYTGGDLPWLKV